MTRDLKCLADCHENTNATIQHLQREELGAEYSNNLLDFGFLPGSQVAILHKYPSQNKLIIQVTSNRVAIRLSDAQYIMVANES